MLSRTANALFWMGRYLERAENTLGLMMAYDFSSLEAWDELFGASSWGLLLSISGDRAAFYEKYEETGKEKVYPFMLNASENPNSIFSCVYKARENARMIQEGLPPGVWETINEMYWDIEETFQDTLNFRDGVWNIDLQDFFMHVHTQFLQIYGGIDANMARSEAYDFLKTGCYLERAGKTARLLHAFHLLQASNLEERVLAKYHTLLNMLYTTHAYEYYMRRFRFRLNAQQVTDLLLTDSQFPRSVLFGLQQVLEGVIRLSQKEPPGVLGPSSPEYAPNQSIDRVNSGSEAAHLQRQKDLTLGEVGGQGGVTWEPGMNGELVQYIEQVCVGLSNMKPLEWESPEPMARVTQVLQDCYEIGQQIEYDFFSREIDHQ